MMTYVSRPNPIRIASVLLAFAGLSGQALAGSTGDHSAGNMWGTAAGGVGVAGATESAITHAQNGAIAGQVNAAKAGLLFNTGPGGGSISAIGSQSIVSTTVFGSGNDIDIDANQTSSNSGDVTNDGTLVTN